MAFKALSRQEQEFVLTLVSHDKTLRGLLEDISDRLVLQEERDKPGRPLRDYIQERESRGRGGNGSGKLTGCRCLWPKEFGQNC
jgi:hypothetical protein